jgi:hypothetical protein
LLLEVASGVKRGQRVERERTGRLRPARFDGDGAERIELEGIRGRLL